MMYQEHYYSFKSDPKRNFQCVKIPYKRTYFSMLIILPNYKFAIDDVLKNFDGKTIQSLKHDEIFKTKHLSLKITKLKVGIKLSDLWELKKPWKSRDQKCLEQSTVEHYSRNYF